MSSMKFFDVSLVVLALGILPLSAAAQDEEQGLSTLAVQNRQHSMIHEFGVGVGTLPIDAFTKGLTFSGAYSIHFNDLLGWEIGQFTYSYHIDTKLREELEEYDVQPTEFEVVKYFVTTNLLVKPLYGKLALLNRTLIYGEIFLAVGGGWGWLSITNRAIADFGAGLRLYAGKYVSFRVDVRDYMFLTKDDVQNELWLGANICLGLGRRKSQ
jgi:outer membrane beta-barrel protein